MPSKYKSVNEASLKRIRARSRGKPSFAGLFPEKRATRCLHPGAESLRLDEVGPGNKLYFEWICENNPDHTWPAIVNNRSRYGCPHCYNEQRAEKVRTGKTKPENLLKVRFPEYYAQLICAFDRNGKEIAQETVAATSSATGVWDTGCGHGPFEMPIKNRTQPGASFGCRQCANLASGERMRAAALQRRGALRETHPTLASEWLALDDPHTQRLDITPDTCPPTSAFRVWWQCSEPLPTGKPCNRRYPATIADRTNGRHGCPDCANRNARGQKKRTSAIARSGSVCEHPVLGAELRGVLKPGKQHLTSSDISTQSNYLCLWGCSLHPGEEIRTSPTSRLRLIDGEVHITGCSVCSVEKRREWGYTQSLATTGCLASTHPQLAANWLACVDRPEQTPLYTSAGSKLNAFWQCSQNSGHPPWPAPVVNRVNGSGCPTCFEARRKHIPRLAALKIRGAITDTHPELALEFTRCISSPKLNADELTSGSAELCEWLCNIHQTRFNATVYERVAGKSNCPTCGKQNIRAALQKSAIVRSGTLRETFPEIASQWVAPMTEWIEPVTPDTVSPHSNLYAYWRCDEHDEPFVWPASIGNRTRGHGCPRCNSSKGELAVGRALTELKIQFQEQLYVSQLTKLYGLKGSSISGRMRYDFAIIGDNNEVRALVEYHGIQHYEPVNFYQSLRTDREVHAAFERGLQRDQDKAQLANDLGIPLLVIPYWSDHDIEVILTEFFGALPSLLALPQTKA